MLCYTRDELIGLHASDVVAGTEIPHLEPVLDALNAGSEYHREWQFRRKDGSHFVAEVIGTKLPDGNLLAMVRDLTERKRAEAREREAEEAERAQRAKSEFLSRMSHELRTPLHAILGYAQLMEQDPRSPDDQESIGEILRAGQRLLVLINERLEIP
ncbi:MAG: sensory box histidine kinase/response regulator [Akkermansiaceae bacterium]|nr:sensory box histidine kinase/response regulator [Akkermansiaceae bacterium]